MPFRSPGSTVLGSTVFDSLSFTSSMAAALAALLLALGCDNDYPIAPTECDDWCHATQRADCTEDEEPDECVSICEESALGRQYPECEPEWVELTECYRQAPDSAFTCVKDYSQPLNSLCLEQRRAANYCVSERAGLCFDRCVRDVEACGGTLSDCEWQCSVEIEDGCAAERLALDRCLLEEPVVCRAEGSPDSPDDLRCCERQVALFDCAGYPGLGCDEPTGR